MVNNWQRRLLWISVIVMAALLGWQVNAWRSQPSTELKAIEPIVAVSSSKSANFRAFSPAKLIAPFELPSTKTGSFTNQDLLGKWSFVLFGYTYCPDVCPTTLARLKGVYRHLQQQANVQVIFVSADPLRDDLPRLEQYINYFEPEFIALTTSHDKLFPFAQGLLLPYGIIAQAPSDDYAVSHSASIALINPQGQLQGQFKPDFKLGSIPIVDMKLMAQQFEIIIAQAPPH